MTNDNHDALYRSLLRHRRRRGLRWRSLFWGLGFVWFFIYLIYILITLTIL